MLKSKPIDYFIMTLGVMVSGSPFLIEDERLEGVLISTFILFFLFAFFRKKVFDLNLVIPVVFYFCILVYQADEFDFLSWPTIIGFYVRIMIGFYIFYAVKNSAKVYVSVMCWTSIISFCFFIPSEMLRFIGVDFKGFFEPIRFLSMLPTDLHIILYNFDGKGEVGRNSAYFWEPGAFAGYIFVAIIFMALTKDEYVEKEYKKNLGILTLAMISTFSTMGYLIFPIALIIASGFLDFDKHKVSKKLIVFVFVLLPLILFLLPILASLDFIGEKINIQYLQAIEQRDDWQQNRFGNMLFDWEYIELRPWFGWGLHESTRYALHDGEAIGRLGNGLTGMVAKLGFVGLLFYICFLYAAFNRCSGGQSLKAALSVLILLLSMNGETFLHFPLFWGLLFLAKKKVALVRIESNTR